MSGTRHGSSKARFLIGIDLGTTQCALSYLDLESENRKIENFRILQFTGKGQIESRPTLPSLLFLPEDAAAFGTPPWTAVTSPIVGELARELGFDTPARLVHSAKSWLCHPRVDRRAPILPWQSELVKNKMSPIEASAAYLRHLADVWNYTMADSAADRLENQHIVVTVPASFDPVARNLTLEAIAMAGLPLASLLEEPLAAFYDFLARTGNDIADELYGIKTVLVIDVGGGTTDFSLIGIEKTAEGDELGFSRLAVGPHLLIGGDNLDLAVAKMVEERFRKKGRKLVAKQWLSLLAQSRAAKELALSEKSENIKTAKFTIIGAGSRVVAQSFIEEIPLDCLREMLVEGYFPLVGADERPNEQADIGLSEVGLPYSRDSAVTRHLAAFLADSGILPDAVLFNGGTMLSKALRERILKLLTYWRGKTPKELYNPHPTLAVASGAVSYSSALLGFGKRIQAGSPVSIYLGIGNKTDRSGRYTPTQVVCLLPKGSEVERSYEIKDKRFGVDVGQNVAFYAYFTPSPPKKESCGDVYKFNARKFIPLPPLKWSAEHTDDGETGIRQVNLAVNLRETGRLQVVCHGCEGDGFKRELTFDLTPDEETENVAAPKSLSKRRSAQVKKIFDSAFSSDPNRPRFNQIFKVLEKTLESRREDWNLATLRALFDMVIDDKRFQNDEEAQKAWLRLVGYTLRPGFGAGGDDIRIERLVSCFDQPLNSHNTALWAEWWIMWKRVAPGLQSEMQTKIAKTLEAVLFNQKKNSKAPQKKAVETTPINEAYLLHQPDQYERNQMWRLLGHCERLPVEEKIRLGTKIIDTPTSFGKDQTALYALGRLGSRILSYASPELIVPVAIVSEWVKNLLPHACTPGGSSYVDWALREFARLTGDKLVQIDDGLRKRILDKLRAAGRKKSFLQPLLEIQRFQKEELAEFCGESLPSGFVWVTDSSVLKSDKSLSALSN